MAPLIPMFAYGLARLVAPDRWPDRRAVVVLLVLACLLPLSVGTKDAIALARNSRNYTRVELAPLAEWLQANIRPQAKIMLHDAGYLGYALDNPMVDMVGLKSVQAQRLHHDLTLPTCGAIRSRAVALLIALERPDYLIVLHDWEDVFRITGLAEGTAHLKTVWKREHGYTVYSMSYDAARAGPR
jgi:hypothetical protein